jgi:hypothetical protein
LFRGSIISIAFVGIELSYPRLDQVGFPTLFKG